MIGTRRGKKVKRRVVAANKIAMKGNVGEGNSRKRKMKQLMIRMRGKN